MNLTRTFAALAVTVATFAGGLSTGAGMASNDTDLALASDPAASAGVCRTYVGTITIYSCAPVTSPNGAPMVGKVQEDGSARYADGLVYDAEDATFGR